MAWITSPSIKNKHKYLILIHECLYQSLTQRAIAEISPSALLNFIFCGRHTAQHRSTHHQHHHSFRLLYGSRTCSFSSLTSAVWFSGEFGCALICLYGDLQASVCCYEVVHIKGNQCYGHHRMDLCWLLIVMTISKVFNHCSIDLTNQLQNRLLASVQTHRTEGIDWIQSDCELN